MARQLLQMTKEIFENLKQEVQEEHREFIIDVERHIDIREPYKDKCCDFLKRAIIIGLDTNVSFTMVFIKYQENTYIGIDSRYADELEKNGYIIEENREIIIGSQILCVAEKFFRTKVDSIKLVNNCLGLEAEDGKSSVVFLHEEILDLIYDITVFSTINNELELSMESKDDLHRLFLLLMVSKNAQLSNDYKELLLELASMTVVRKISRHLFDFITLNDNRIKFLRLYQCIEYLFIPNRASEFREKYNMNISDALKLHIDEAMKRDERGNVIAVLKRSAGMQIVQKVYIQLLLGGEENENKLEKVSNWIYDLRCTIAHFRYGQDKEETPYDWDKIFVLMLELLVSIYHNIDIDMQDICSGIIAV